MRPLLLCLLCWLCACSGAQRWTTGDAGSLRISLNGAWTSPMGLLNIPAPRQRLPFYAQRSLRIPEDWGSQSQLVLHADATGWQLQVTVNGVDAGTGIGGLWPVEIDLSGQLKPGMNQLQLQFISPEGSNVRPGGVAQNLAPWTFSQPRPGRVLSRGDIWLERRPSQRIEDLDVDLMDGQLTATARTQGARGQRLRFKVVRDGRVLKRFPAAQVGEDDLASSTARWSGPLWQPGGSDEPFLQYMVAELEGGGSRQLRFGARELTLADGQLRINGRLCYLAGQRFVSHRGIPRQELAEQRQLCNQRGSNALDLHGEPHPAELFEAADELGLLLVLTPRCEGQGELRSWKRPPEDWERFIVSSGLRLADARRDHPSLVLWANYNNFFDRPSLFEPFVRTGIPTALFDDSQGVGMAPARDLMKKGLLPPYINELPWNRIDPEVLVRNLRKLVKRHSAQGLGLVLPNVWGGLKTEGDLTLYYQQAFASSLADAGVQAPPLDARRGPAKLEVTLLRAGEPAPGEIALLRLPHQPPMAAASDARGVAHFEVDFTGEARLETLSGQQQPVQLENGIYLLGSWHPAVAKAQLSLDGGA